MTDEAARARVIWVAVSMVAVFGFAQGATYPLLSTLLERKGESPFMIGLSAAMTPLGVVMSAGLLPRLLSRFPAPAVTMASAFAGALVICLIAVTDDPRWWLLLRFALGVAINGLYVIGELWVLTVENPAQRARAVGLFGALVAAGFAAGPFALAAVGAGPAAFLIAISSFTICFLLVAVNRRTLPRPGVGEKSGSLARFARQAPTLLLAVAMVSLFEAALMSLFPVYGPAFGHDARTTALMLGVAATGPILAPMLVGRLALRFSARRILIVSALASALGALMLGPLMRTPLIWPFLLLWGCAYIGVYMAALLDLADRFSGAALVAGNSAFAVAWGAGGLWGGPLAGAMIDAFGPVGLPATQAAGFGLLALIAWRRSAAISA